MQLAKKREIFSSYFYSLPITIKLSVLFILVFSVLLILLSVLIYQVSSTILINKTVENTRQNLNLVSEKLDIVLDNTENYSKVAITDQTIQDTLSRGTWNDQLAYYKNYIAIRDALSNIISPKTFIDAMIIYDMHRNVFDSGGIGDIQGLDRRTTREFLISPDTLRWFDTHQSPYRKELSRFNIITLLQRIRSGQTGELLGIITTNINEKYISSLYSKIKIGINGNIFIINQSGTIISHSQKNRLYNSITNQPYYKWMIHHEGGKVFTMENKGYLIVNKYYERLGWMIVGTVPIEEITQDNKLLMNRIFLLSIISIFLAIVLSIVASTFITRPLIKLKETVRYIGEGDLEAKVDIQSKDEIGALASEFNRMVERTSGLMDRIVNEQKKKKEYELALLQSQLNPHFLYNTLESICGLAELNRNEEIISTVNELALFYRGVLSKGSNIIPIKDELSITERYLKILKVRYGEQLAYDLEIDPQIYQYNTVKLVLQPLVENSVYHGIKNKRGQGFIKIQGLIEKDKVIIYVTDNGAGIQPERMPQLLSGDSRRQQAKSFGLKSTNDRIKLYFGEEYGLEVQSVYGEGTTVKIILPMKEIRGEIDDESNNYR